MQRLENRGAKALLPPPRSALRGKKDSRHLLSQLRGRQYNMINLGETILPSFLHRLRFFIEDRVHHCCYMIAAERHVPVSISKDTTPKQKMWERASASPRGNSSGAIYASVPAVLNGFVSFNEPFSLASPKSMTFTWFFELTMTFSTLISRCTIPLLCQTSVSR